MPELPEVESVVRSLAPHLPGRTITHVVHLRDDMLTPPNTPLARLLARRTISTVTRRAKRIVLTLDNGHAFYIHLGMTGRLLICAARDKLPNHTHLRLRLDDDRELRFVDPRRFGLIAWLGHPPTHANVGPEPLTLSAKQLADRLARTKRSIKSALLDQKLIAGLGNIYVDEALHRARILPHRRTDTLTPDDTRRLNRAIKSILRHAIAAGGSTLRDYVNANGEAGSFQTRHHVYARRGKPCRTCQTPITRETFAGRGTHYCAHCQR